jgi:iron complex outermembrane receptor protein
MRKLKCSAILAGWSIGFAALAVAAFADNFNIPGGDLRTALDAYAAQTRIHLLYVESAVSGVRTNGIRGSLSADDAMSRLLKGTGFSVRREAGAMAIVRDSLNEPHADGSPIVQMAATASNASGAALETVTVTSSKIGGDVQNIPISITALSQEQLTATQTAGGPDLIKQVPNMTFTKTNFSGYSIQIRGIGTQAIQ